MSHEALTQAAKILAKAGRPLRTVKALEWSESVKVRFLAKGGTELPRPRPRKHHHPKVHEAVAEARRLVPDDTLVGAWLRRQADALEATASLLESTGTPDFLRYGSELFGTPTTPLIDGQSTSLQLATRVDKTLRRLSADQLGSEPEPMSAELLAMEIQRNVDRLLGDASPRVFVDPTLGAKASASASRIRIRKGAHFTKEDVNSLVMHEAMVHIATSANGRAQRRLPILGIPHAGTTRTQEGLAVFSELISGSLGPSRLWRLANRVLAIQRVIDGADFLDIYRFFLERVGDESHAYDDTRRIFRGGVLTGGVPLTKDGVYLDGLVRVHNFLRAVVELRRPDLLPLLFCGKLDVDDLPALSLLHRDGLIVMPRHLPPWVEDRRFIVSYLTYSGFLNRIRLKTVREHFSILVSECAPKPETTAPAVVGPRKKRVRRKPAAAKIQPASAAASEETRRRSPVAAPSADGRANEDQREP